MQRALGIISGTSLDGIDVAVIETDGCDCVNRLGGATLPYPVELSDRLLALLKRPEIVEGGDLTDLEASVTRAHVAAARTFLEQAGVDKARISVAGFHGQTVLHAPQRRFTRQLFDGDLGAGLLGIDVVAQFRLADVRDGGQGAPLVPLYHRALVASSKLEAPVMVLNLGGVGNVTYVDGSTLIAFDTGPASALIDDWMRACGLGSFDTDGALARRGRVDRDKLAVLLSDPFFERPPPKSLDRNQFHGAGAIVDGLSPADGAATLTAFTIAATADAVRHVPRVPQRWLVAGGGRQNGAIMDGLRTAVGVPVETVEAVGWDGDVLEAECFAYLAVRSKLGLPLSVPTTTGVSRPMPGGTLHRTSAT